MGEGGESISNGVGEGVSGGLGQRIVDVMSGCNAVGVGIVSGMITNQTSSSCEAAAGRIGRTPAAAAASTGSITPPLTNRGCVVPSEVQFHLDYLKLTIFSYLETVMMMVESG